MFINFAPINFQYKITQNSRLNQSITNPSRSLLAYDTVSFGAMKKKEFDGIDLAVVEKFKAPIEKFNNNEDLQNWAGKKAKAIANKDFGGRQTSTEIQRKVILNEWSDYVFNETDAYKNTAALLILNAITKDLKSDSDNIPPALNKGVLADCIYEIDKNIKSAPKYQFDFNKMYQNKLRVFYMDDGETNTGETATKWIVIPSVEHDRENFETNLKKMKALSYKTWCTKSNNAVPYLVKGDFHVYLENGKPKLGVRFVGDKIQEIQGTNNNNRIPFTYFDVIDNYIKENNFKLSNRALDELNSAKRVKKELQKIKVDLKAAIEVNDIKTIYNYFGIETEEDKDGYLIISAYKQPSKDYTFKDIGINENRLLEKVKKIKGDADFGNSQITDLKNLEFVGGNVNFNDSQVINLEKLAYIGGNTNFRNSKVINLGNLKVIGGAVDFQNSQIKSLNKLESIGGGVIFSNSQVSDLGNLKQIRGSADFSSSVIKSLNKLESIAGSAIFNNSRVTDLGNLKAVAGAADFSDSGVKSLNKLESIGGSAIFSNSQVTDLGNLKSITGNADFSNSEITDLGKLEYINENADFSGSKVISLGKLKSIGGIAYFQNSKVRDLGNLEYIGSYANFYNSQVRNLGNLKSIGGDANFKNSYVWNLGKLQYIAGNVYIGNSLLQAENFKNINICGQIIDI